MEIILQKLTEVGVDEIVLVQTKRSVVKVDDKKEDKKFERWERIIYEAAKQSKRGKIPKLRGILTFNETVSDMKNNDLNICPYENEKTISIKSAIKNENIDSVGIFIGPEGGFDEEEIKALQNEDVKVVSLGPRILRTETASVVASSIVLYELSDLGGN
jgi:16S rRNA (uracil1498-N3)-methyltransferase